MGILAAGAQHGYPWLTDGLRARYDFRETSGTIASEVMFGRNGTLVNMAGTEWTTGPNANLKALAFDGSNDYVSLPSSASFAGMTEFTACAWFYVIDQPAVNSVLIKENSVYVGDARVNLFIASSMNNITFVSRDVNVENFGTFDTLLFASVQPTSTWIHIAATYLSGSSGKKIIYKNGSNVAEKTLNTGSMGTSTASMTSVGAGQIAGGTFNNQTHGKIADLRIYNKALSAAQIAAIYAGTA